MNKLKKVGLSALAGSLVATSAIAGEMAVSGSAKLTYTDREQSSGATGTPFGINKLLGFSGSGEMENGWVVSVYFGNNGTSQSSASLSIDMGDMGKLTYDSGVGGHGIGSIDDKTPTAAEEIWDNISYGTGHDGFRVGIGNSGALAYSTTVGAVSISADYVRQGGGAVEDGATGAAGTGSGTSIALTMSPSDGLNVGAGVGNKGTGNASEEDKQKTAFATFAVGPATIGLQRAYQDSAGTDADWTTTQYGISFAVNENLSLSYGARTVDAETSLDEEGTGIAASYTMGSMSITANHNEVDDIKGAAGNKETTEIAVSFAF
jgi:outer membrane protein OmpU